MSKLKIKFAQVILLLNNPIFSTVYSVEGDDVTGSVETSDMTEKERKLWVIGEAAARQVNIHYDGAMGVDVWLKNFVVGQDLPGRDIATIHFEKNFGSVQNAPILSVEVEFEDGTYLQRSFSTDKSWDVYGTEIFSRPTKANDVAQILFKFMNAKPSNKSGGSDCGILGEVFPSLCNADKYAFLALGAVTAYKTATTSSTLGRVAFGGATALLADAFWKKGGFSKAKK